MDLSLVICTRNRGQYLWETLQSLTKVQGNVEWELVVVDNGSTDNTGEILNRFRRQFPHPFGIVYEPIPGLGRARNSGWRTTHGPIVAFTDDDCYPSADYFHKILECFERDEISFVGGRVLLHDQTDYPITIQMLERSMELLPGDFVTPGLIQGANFAFRRSALERVNGFDDRMGAGTPFACEDIDILARLLANGLRGIYSPRPLIYHHHRRKNVAEVSRLVKIYDHGRGAYYAKCLLSPALRKVYARNWYWQACNQSFLTTVREVLGAIHFLCRPPFADSPKTACL